MDGLDVRMVFDIMRGGKSLAMIEYPVSSTPYSLEILHSLYQNVLKDADSLSKKELILHILSFVNMCAIPDSNQKKEHGGLANSDLAYVQTRYPTIQVETENISENCGLVHVSPGIMNALKYSGNFEMTIDLDQKTVRNGIWGDIDKVSSPAYEESFVDPSEFIFDQIEYLYDLVQSCHEQGNKPLCHKDYSYYML